MNQKKSMKVIIVSVIFGVLLIAGGAFAFFTAQKTPKDQYLLAEFNTFKQYEKVFKDRFKNEIEWSNKHQETPVEYTYDIAIEYDNEFYDENDWLAAQVLNNTTYTLNVAIDPKEQLMALEVGGKVLDTEIDHFKGYITPEKLLLALPFTDDIIQLKDEEFGKVMSQFDPSFNGDETLGLNDWMGKNSFLTEENMKYLQNEYLLYFYKSLPDEAFTVEEEEVEVHGEKLKANKITMELSEDDIINTIVSVLEKAKEDQKFEDIVIETLENLSGTVGSVDEEYDIDVEEALDSMIEGAEEISIPDGIVSTVWVNSDVVVQREIEIGEFTIEGTQTFTANTQEWEYSIGDKDLTLYFNGDLSFKDGKTEDEITLLDDNNTGFTYSSSEELDGGEREFERVLELNDGFDNYELSWEGSSTYKGDSMSSENEIVLTYGDFYFNLTLDEAGKFIKSVEIPEGSDGIVNLGDMNEDELNEYFESELIPKAEKWATDLFYEVQEAFYNF